MQHTYNIQYTYTYTVCLSPHRDHININHPFPSHCHSLTIYPLHLYHLTLSCLPYILSTGHLSFHTIAKLSTVHRKRRDVEAEGSSNKLVFSLSLSNMTHSFEMSPSTDILSPRYVLEEVSEDGRLVTVPSTVKDCYYIQDIRQTGLSAVTVCSHTVVSILLQIFY